MLFVACQTKESDTRQEVHPESFKAEKEQDTIKTQSNPKLIQRKEKAHSKTKNDTTQIKEDLPIKVDLISDPIDGYNGDPFEDPDYIGTPCGDYINGKCTRHRHKEDLYERFGNALDSLRN